MEIDEVQPEGDREADWRIPYLDCLIREVLPSDRTQAQQLAH
jgi:hypothetical protein